MNGLSKTGCIFDLIGVMACRLDGPTRRGRSIHTTVSLSICGSGMAPSCTSTSRQRQVPTVADQPVDDGGSDRRGFFFLNFSLNKFTLFVHEEYPTNCWPAS
jgi:hypothetical protein